MQRSLWILAAAGLMTAGPASAQELGLSDMYGRGVHAYFSGQPRYAYDLLTASISAGSRDPRAFYFRGLAYQRLGRPSEAQADFRAGAELEHQDVGGVFGVDRALERVQGPSRLAIERHRAVARVAAVQEVVLERNRRSISAQAATPEVSAPGDQVLGEPPSDFSRLSAPGAMPPVKGEVDKPFPDPAADPNAPATPASPVPAPPKPAQPNPLNEAPPFGEPAPAKPAAPVPPGGNQPAPGGEEPAGSGRAVGNALKRAFGGFMPSLPELPAGLPLGGGQGQAPPVKPAGEARPPATPPAAKPAPAKNDNPFGNP